MSDPLTSIKTITGIASSASGVIGQVIAGIERYKNLKADEDAYIRLLYLEVLHNMEVLEAIKVDGLTGVQPNDAAFKSLVDQLSLDIMAGVFAPGGKQNKKIYDFLADNGTIRYTNQSGMLTDQEKKEDKLVETSVLKTIVFLVTKIEVLKKVANIGEQAFMKDLRLKPRINNIKIRLDFLRRKLKAYDKLENMV